MNDKKFNPNKANYYEEIARKTIFGYDQLFVMALSFLMDNYNDDANVLVVGCGTGIELITFGKLMPHWKITGVDPSEEMINIARQRVKESRLNERVRLLHGYVDEIPDVEKYDVVSLIFVMKFISDKNRKLALLKDISKRLNTGAKLVLVDQFVGPSYEDIQLMLNGWKNFMKLSGVPSEAAIKIAIQSIEKCFLTDSEIRYLLSEAGFGKATQFFNSLIHGGWIARKK